MKKFIPILLALACAAFLLPPVMALINGEPFRAVFIVIGMVFLTFSIASSRALKEEVRRRSRPAERLTTGAGEGTSGQLRSPCQPRT